MHRSSVNSGQMEHLHHQRS
ncbi:hypothetical protein HaLaN_00794, partial [Haematococcus lacustris]